MPGAAVREQGTVYCDCVWIGLRARRLRVRTSTGTALDVTLRACGRAPFLRACLRVNLPYHLRTLSVPTRNANVTACVTHDRGSQRHTRLPRHTAHPCRTSRPQSCSWSSCSSPSERRVRSRACHVDAKVVRARTAVRGGHEAKNRLAEGTYEGVLVARVGVRDKVGPQCVTERSTHVLGDSPEQPAPALLCALAPHLAQFDRVGGLVGTQAMSLHPRAAVVPWLREPAITARSRVRAWRRLGGRPWCRRR